MTRTAGAAPWRTSLSTSHRTDEGLWHIHPAGSRPSGELVWKRVPESKFCAHEAKGIATIAADNAQPASAFLILFMLVS